VLIICAVVLLSMPESSVPDAAISNWVVVAVVGKDLWVIVGFIVIYLVTDKFRVAPTRWGKASTCGQLLMVALVLASPDLNYLLPGGAGSRTARVAQWIVAGLSVAAVISYTRLGLSFVAQHDKPLENHGEQRRQRTTNAQH
jgi:phosphatidylglycerophosphate synthase